MTTEEFPAALAQGLTLDQMNLRAGDELVVDFRATGTTVFRNVMAVVGLAVSVSYLVSRIF